MSGRTPERRESAPPAETSPEVDAFLDAMASARPRGGEGRLAIVLDATMSRQSTWDAAMAIQSEMFVAAAARGGIEIELVFFRGFEECRASGWVRDAKTLTEKMTAVSCHAGRTQIGRALKHVLKRAEAGGVHAFVYVGDAFEENADLVCDVAGQLGLRGVKGFVFHEGGDPQAGLVFREIARLTGGSYHVFDLRAPHVLKGLLGAAAAYAAGGFTALTDYARTAGGAAGEVARALPRPAAGESGA
jgi:hypothetical protein